VVRRWRGACEGGQQVSDLAEDGTPMIAVTMSTAAAKCLVKALLRGAAALEEKGHEDDYEWLMWAVGRVVTPIPVSAIGVDSK
jgi:hypothetical protein